VFLFDCMSCAASVLRHRGKRPAASYLLQCARRETVRCLQPILSARKHDGGGLEVTSNAVVVEVREQSMKLRIEPIGRHRGRATGVTLMELMIVIVIIGILAAIGYPSYLNHVRKSNRAAAQAFMMDVANREKQYILDARQYIAVANNDVFPAALNMSVPTDVSRFYRMSVTTTATPPSFTVTATAQGSQVADGNLELRSDGTKLPTNKW
jgi:type IV pilus assembly protein PilE